MGILIYIFYNILIIILYPLIIIGFLLSRKGRKSLRGRKKLFEKLKKIKKQAKDKEIIWFHVSSRGEFEQARSIIREIPRDRYFIYVSVFSPSGYEALPKAEEIDAYSYIPLDLIFHIYKFFKILNPEFGVFIRYELWPNLVVLGSHFSKLYMFDATLDNYKPRSFYKFLYNRFVFIGCVDEDVKKEFISKLNIFPTKIKVIGDSRVDQVLYRKENMKRVSIKSFIKEINQKFIILGSSWEKDEEMFFSIYPEIQKVKKNIKIVIAPHEPYEENIIRIERRIKELGYRTTRYTECEVYSDEEFIIIDTMGILTELYKFSYIAYVGGGFGAGVHNIFEPMLMEKPVIFGPNYKRSREAVYCVKNKIAFSIDNSYDLLVIILKLLKDKEYYQNIIESSKKYIEKHIGASKRYAMLFA